MRVPAGSECYICWAKRRRDHPGMDQAAVNSKTKADKKFNEQHDSDRADMVRGKRCAATGGDRLDEALTVKGERSFWQTV